MAIFHLRLTATAVAVLFAWAYAAATPVDPIRGVLVDRPFDNDFLFQAAMKGSLGAVEYEWRGTDYGADGMAKDVTVRFRLQRVNDFGLCANAKHTFGRIYKAHGGVVASDDSDEWLVRGVCVIAEPIADFKAAYQLRMGTKPLSVVLVDRADGRVLNEVDTDNLWTLFGLPAEPALTTEVKKYLLLHQDQVTDEELVRALRGPERTRAAAIKVLSERVVIDERAARVGTHARLKKTAGASVASALLASGALRDPREQTRAKALRAAAALPEAAALLEPEVLAALRTPVHDEEVAAFQERARQLANARSPEAKREARGFRAYAQQLGYDVSNWPGIKPPLSPGRSSPHVRDKAGVAAAMMGQTTAQRVLDDLWDELVVGGTGWADDGGDYLLVAAAGTRGEKLVRALLATTRATANNSARYEHALRMVLSMRRPSPILRDLVMRFCNGPLKDDWLIVKCDILRVRDGQRDVLKQLESKIALHWETRSHGDTYAPFDAAEGLLIALAPDGIQNLRHAALSSKEQDAIVAVETLCLLGSDAGAGILRRAEHFLAAAPDNYQRRRIVESCRLTGKTNLGWFLKLP
jgi:hypothetical protein